jgi:hypothetical protein
VARKKPKKDMPKRAKRPVLSFRVSEKLLDQLKGAAGASTLSIADEAEQRLTKSFEADESFGGQELRWIVYGMFSAFALAGETAARGKGIKDQRWLDDSYCYLSALFGAMENLIFRPGAPAFSAKQFLLHFESLKGRVMTREINRQTGGGK